jgi:hypothetical protein
MYGTRPRVLSSISALAPFLCGRNRAYSSHQHTPEGCCFRWYEPLPSRSRCFQPLPYGFHPDWRLERKRTRSRWIRAWTARSNCYIQLLYGFHPDAVDFRQQELSRPATCSSGVLNDQHPGRCAAHLLCARPPDSLCPFVRPSRSRRHTRPPRTVLPTDSFTRSGRPYSMSDEGTSGYTSPHADDVGAAAATTGQRLRLPLL